MKKSKKLLTIIAPVLAVTATAAIVTTTLTSCARVEEPFKWDPKKQWFNFDLNLSKPATSTDTTVDRPTILPQKPTNKELKNDNIDPNYCLDPFTYMFDEEFKKHNSIKDHERMEVDFKEIIYNYLTTMPKGSSAGSIQLADKQTLSGAHPIKDVTMEIALRKDFPKTKKITIKADVWIKTDSTKANDTNDGETEETHKGARLVKGVTIDLYAEFAGKEDILKIIQRVIDNKQTTKNTTTEDDTPVVELTDYEKLMSLLVGNNNSDNPFNFEFKDIETLGLPAINEVGVLKYISNFNDLTNSNAKLFGYTFDVSQFWKSLNDKANGVPKKESEYNTKTIDEKCVYWAPSYSFSNIFIPKIANGSKAETKPYLTLKANKVKGVYNSFESLKESFKDFNTQVTDKNKLDTLIQNLKNMSIELPFGIEKAKTTNTTFSVSSDSKAASVESISLDIEDKNANKFTFNFYSNWWKKQQPKPETPSTPEKPQYYLDNSKRRI